MITLRKNVILRSALQGRVSKDALPLVQLRIATQLPPTDWIRPHNASATAREPAGRRTW